jgi:hypothetical protein
MEFRTAFKQKVAMPSISYNSSILLLGSCFSDVMGQKLKEAQFNCVSNPFGVIFNTSSLRFWFEQVLHRRTISVKDLVNVQDNYVHFQAHSKFNASEADVVLNKLQDAFDEFQASVGTASHIFITLGTAWVYERIDSKEIVANCHKVPQVHFRKVLQTTTQIEEDLKAIKGVVNTLNPEAKLIFTVSPVRHLKDGMVENQRSKSHLITALHQYLEQQKEDFYFPSYELLLDDLRDYRFYDRDLLHPNDLAVDYIWNFFEIQFFDTETSFWKSKIMSLVLDLAHRPQHKDSKNYAKHLAQMHKKKDEIRKKWPQMMFIID